MPMCEICGETEDNVYTCKKCRVKFCEYCGDVESSLCLDCLAEEDLKSDEELEDSDFDEEPDRSIKPHLECKGYPIRIE